MASSQAEREEDELRSSLERTRTFKLVKLKDDRPRARGGSSGRGPHRFRVDSTAYSRRTPKWDSPRSATPVPSCSSGRQQLTPHRINFRRDRMHNSNSLPPQMSQGYAYPHAPPPPLPPSPFPLYPGIYGSQMPTTPQWGQGMMTWPGPQAVQSVLPTTNYCRLKVWYKRW